MIGLGIGVPQVAARGGRAVLVVAPDYVEPTEPDQSQIIVQPVPPTTTPIDAETGLPEPGIDPTFSEPERIEIADSGQTPVRTTKDPSTFGVSYFGTEIYGQEYWEFEIQKGTPDNASFAVGITTTDMPLNGVPGERSTEIAWWSDGTIRQGGLTILDLGATGKLVRGDKGGVAIDYSGAMFIYKNCSALNGGLSVASVTPSPGFYPFAALYSEKTRINFKFASGKFACPIPSGFWPLGQAPATGGLEVGQILGSILYRVPDQTVQVGQVLGTIIYKESV